MILYYSARSCALAPHLALEHVGAKYEARRLDFSKNEQRSEEFLRINPKGRVPVLIADEGILTEAPAILTYISHLYPEAGLAPINNPFLYAQIQAFNSYLCSTLHVAHAHGYRGYRWVDADNQAALDAMKRKMPQTVSESFALIEQDVLQGPWVFGEHYTISDMYLFTVAQWLEMDGIDTGKLPKVMAHRQRMMQDPIVQRVLQEQQKP